MQHRKNWDADGYSTIKVIVKKDCQQIMLPERKIIKAIITAKFPVNMVASVLEYLERGYGIN